MNHSTAPALAIFDEAYSDFDHCFNCLGFDTVEKWSVEFEIGALDCLDVFKSFTSEQLQELYDVVRLDAFARAQILDAWNWADELGPYSESVKYAREMIALDLDLNAKLLRFKIMAMENLARATDSYSMDFTQ